jgi:hypothetical protein
MHLRLVVPEDVMLLYPPYTAWHLSYVAIGAAPAVSGHQVTGHGRNG